MTDPLRAWRQQGFSLLEVLVAFAILSLSLGILFQIFSTSVRGTLVSEGYNQALIVARSTLARVGRETALEEGALEGEVDGIYHWQLRMTPYAEEGAQEGPAPGPAKAYRVAVTVAWKAGQKTRRVKLETLRLATASGRG
ncbi:MAG TPA: type II secretion system protein [Sedimenticola sp.]|nr:type II secretion system protein [Sedimenticola sp.]